MKLKCKTKYGAYRLKGHTLFVRFLSSDLFEWFLVFPDPAFEFFTI